MSDLLPNPQEPIVTGMTVTRNWWRWFSLLSKSSSDLQSAALLVPPPMPWGTLGAQDAGHASITGGSVLGAFLGGTAGNGLTAAGANRATALVLGKQFNRITTAAAGTGVLLPPSSAALAGAWLDIFNDGANPIQVYASGADTIDGVAGATGVPLTNALRARFICVAAGVLVSAQWGPVSA